MLRTVKVRFQSGDVRNNGEVVEAEYGNSPSRRRRTVEYDAENYREAAPGNLAGLIKDGKTYSYLCDLDDVQVGSAVVVEVAKRGLYVAEVAEIAIGRIAPARKFVIAHVDLVAYRARLENNAKAEAILQALETREQEIAQIERYRSLAQTDPQAKALLDQLAALDPSYVPGSVSNTAGPAMYRPIGDRSSGQMEDDGPSPVDDPLGSEARVAEAPVATGPGGRFA